MKKVIFFLLLLASVAANAQILRSEDLEAYSKEKYGEKWVEAAENLASELTLDKNNALTLVRVIEAPGKTKDQLYVLLNYWYNSTFNDASATINLNDKDLGTIIAQGSVPNVATHLAGMTTFHVSLPITIKSDIKDGKVRVTYTMPFYIVIRDIGGGWAGLVLGGGSSKYDEKWLLDKCFPFVAKDGHKKASSKALIMAHAASNAILDKIEECIKNGMVGNEEDEW